MESSGSRVRFGVDAVIDGASETFIFLTFATFSGFSNLFFLESETFECFGASASGLAFVVSLIVVLFFGGPSRG